MNGNDGVVVRGDLLDRCPILEFTKIPHEERHPEKDLCDGFREAKPRILGALLDGVASLEDHAHPARANRLVRPQAFTGGESFTYQSGGVTDPFR